MKKIELIVLLEEVGSAIKKEFKFKDFKMEQTMGQLPDDEAAESFLRKIKLVKSVMMGSMNLIFYNNQSEEYEFSFMFFSEQGNNINSLKVFSHIGRKFWSGIGQKIQVTNSKEVKEQVTNYIRSKVVPALQ